MKFLICLLFIIEFFEGSYGLLRVYNSTRLLNGKLVNNQTIADGSGFVTLLFDGQSFNISNPRPLNGSYSVKIKYDGTPYLTYNTRPNNFHPNPYPKNSGYGLSSSPNKISSTRPINGGLLKIFNESRIINGRFVTNQTIADGGGSVTLLYDGILPRVTTTGHLYGSFSLVSKYDGTPCLHYIERPRNFHFNDNSQNWNNEDTTPRQRFHSMKSIRGGILHIYNETRLINGRYVTNQTIADSRGSATLIFDGSTVTRSTTGDFRNNYRVKWRNDGTPYLEYIGRTTRTHRRNGSGFMTSIFDGNLTDVRNFPRGMSNGYPDPEILNVTPFKYEYPYDSNGKLLDSFQEILNMSSKFSMEKKWRTGSSDGLHPMNNIKFFSIVILSCLIGFI